MNLVSVVVKLRNRKEGLMKKLLFGLMMCLSLTGCVEEDEVYSQPPPGNYQSGCIVLQTDEGNREVCSQYYYSGGYIIYWDYELGAWVGPHGYWRGGAWYHGGWYHGWGRWGFHGDHWGYHGGGYHGEFHGGFHGGGSFHGGGHGGHR